MSDIKKNNKSKVANKPEIVEKEVRFEREINFTEESIETLVILGGLVGLLEDYGIDAEKAGYTPDVIDRMSVISNSFDDYHLDNNLNEKSNIELVIKVTKKYVDKLLQQV